MISSVIFMILAIVLTALAQIVYKLYFKRKDRRYIIFPVLVFAAIPYFNYRALLGIPMDIFYIASSAVMLLVVLLSVVMVGEKVGLKDWCGLGMIVAGITLYVLS